MPNEIHLSATVPESLAGTRLDSALSKLFPDYSRAFLKTLIEKKEALLDGKPAKVRDKVSPGQTVTIDATLPEILENQPQDIPLEILYEDDDLLVVNKPAELVVHPGAGVRDNTLMNALLYHYRLANTLPRAGIVHRLDKDTTGLLVVAKTLATHHALIDAIQQRLIKREYLALVYGELTGGGKIDNPMGRDPKHRTRMAVLAHGKEAITYYRLETRYPGHTLLRVNLETGRTHQIRVHLASIHHPIVGDPVYGGRKKSVRGISNGLREQLQAFPRQALHACHLAFAHPISQKPLEFNAPTPPDMQSLIEALENEK